MQTAFEEVVDIPFIYMQVVQCLKKTEWYEMSCGHLVNSNMCWHFVFKLGGWQMANLKFFSHFHASRCH